VKVRRRLTELENERNGLAQAIAALEGIKRGSLPVTGTTAGPMLVTPPQMIEVARPRVWGTLLDFAEAVLRDAGTPLSVEDMIKRIQARGRDAGRPLAAVRASLVPSLDRSIARGGVFTKPKRGMYALRAWEAKTA